MHFMAALSCSGIMFAIPSVLQNCLHQKLTSPGDDREVEHIRSREHMSTRRLLLILAMLVATFNVLFTNGFD